VYFEANDLDQISSRGKIFINKGEYRNYLIKHLNQSLFISSPVGRIFSYIKAFLDKNVELRN
tara:strand:- start:2106 stop:2291 length:186 start_codon:yes stop_codon:yes gene_type:complete